MTWLWAFLKSLTGRLVVAAVLLSVPAVVGAGLVLTLAFHTYVEGDVDSQLRSAMDNLVGASEIGTDGMLRFVRPLFDSRFNEPYSGHYWQISEPDHEPFRSRSLWDQELHPDMRDRLFDLVLHVHEGPDGQTLRVLEQDIVLPESDRVFRYMVAIDIGPMNEAINKFDRRVAVAIGLALAFVSLAMVAQVAFGLRPIKRLRGSIVSIRKGHISSLGSGRGDWGPDLEPVAEEIDALLDQNRQLLDRARTHVGNLAHALKTPLAVLRNDLADLPAEKRLAMEQQLTALDRHISHHLKRARIAGGGSGPGIPVLERASKLARAVAIMAGDKDITVKTDVPDGINFAGEKEDFDEVLGNLIENASKWAKSEIHISARLLPQAAARPLFEIRVEDDGAGVPEEDLETLFDRGKRLDEATPGTGLGLAIVRDIVELYGGSARLAKASLGGLAVVLTLPVRR